MAETETAHRARRRAALPVTNSALPANTSPPPAVKSRPRCPACKIQLTAARQRHVSHRRYRPYLSLPRRGHLVGLPIGPCEPCSCSAARRRSFSCLFLWRSAGGFRSGGRGSRLEGKVTFGWCLVSGLSEIGVDGGAASGAKYWSGLFPFFRRHSWPRRRTDIIHRDSNTIFETSNPAPTAPVPFFRY